VDLTGKTVILVDDGLATGSSMRAAVIGLGAFHPKTTIVAVPTAALETCEAFEPIVDAIICDSTPQPFYGVGLWYDDFSQTSDAEVRRLLADAGEG
jgi:predicted phosphoribosyltransferase